MSYSRRYYTHGLPPYAAEWQGYAYPGSKVNSELGALGCGPECSCGPCSQRNGLGDVYPPEWWNEDLRCYVKSNIRSTNTARYSAADGYESVALGAVVGGLLGKIAVVGGLGYLAYTMLKKKG